MSENVKPLFGLSADKSDRVVAIMAHVEKNLRELESEGYDIQEFVGVVFAHGEGENVFRALWDTQSDNTRQTQGLLCYAAALLQREAVE